MSTTTAPAPDRPTTTTRDASLGGSTRVPESISKIPAHRLFSVELRKMFDTRAGFWLIASIAITALIASVCVVIFGKESAINASNFAQAIGIPMSILLPVIAVMSVTSEWSQRTGLTTFTLVPHRGRVIVAKLAATLAIAVSSMLLALGIGAVSNLIAATLVGIDPVWNFSLTDLLYVSLGNVLGMLMGFMLGVLLLSTPAAVTGYFVYAMVWPPIGGLLYQNNDWYLEHVQWIDYHWNQTGLFGGGYTAENWLQLAATGAVWCLIPMAIGLVRVMRAEIK